MTTKTKQMTDEQKLFLCEQIDHALKLFDASALMEELDGTEEANSRVERKVALWRGLLNQRQRLYKDGTERCMAMIRVELRRLFKPQEGGAA